MTFSRISQLIASLLVPDPRRDWLSSLAFASLTFVALALWAAYLFFSIGSGSIFPSSDAPAPAISVTRGDIESTLAAYQARQLNYAAHNLPAPAVTDPAQ